MSWTPVLFLPAPLHLGLSGCLAAAEWGDKKDAFSFAVPRYTPHYPRKSPLDDVLQYVLPGSDEYPTEKYASEIARLFAEWTAELRSASPGLRALAKFLSSSLRAAPLTPAEQKTLRSDYGIEVLRRSFGTETVMDREPFLKEMGAYLGSLPRIEVAEFQITSIKEMRSSPITVSLDIRYDFVGLNGNGLREERIGYWQTEWVRSDAEGWRATRWTAGAESVSTARSPIFQDVSAQALGHLDSYQRQMLHGADYWRTVLDGATGVDIYGNTGLAAGDFDNDGLDDLYICQPPGLPNRLYRNRGDGTFEDVTEAAGVGVLDGTACALFADFENKGLQDLLVVCATGPLLFVNQGNGKFIHKRDAFRFKNAPAGTFTSAAIADYDRDGRLDVYFCLYTYYRGLEQYHYPVPYFDARNGPPNFLFHNEGNGVFEDRTEAVGLHIENDRYTFACAWGDYNSDGWPDLYVVNDFGRNNLYRNQGDGTFAAVSDEAQVNEPGAGMSACWADFDNDAKEDIYAAGMWVAAGMRVFEQPAFHEKEAENVRALYERHMAGNSLYRNEGNGRFENVAAKSGTAMGRWTWSAGAWDFDHDGFVDLYMANGYISGLDNRDASSFFWRQVVAKSPASATPSEAYERGWNAINELIRSDASWNGFERNVCFLNNRDGTLSEVSGSVGLDFLDDSRTFVLADLDHDGRLEIILKNRTSPQLRVLRNAMKEIGGAVAFRLQGKASNRDAIGTAVMVEAGELRQTKLLQAGSGFLAQHGKELFFGVGDSKGSVRASIRWPSGATQVFENLPVNHRIAVREGESAFQAQPFAPTSAAYQRPGKAAPGAERLPAQVETWLIQPMQAPDFTLPDLTGGARQLSKLRGHFVLLHFWDAPFGDAPFWDAQDATLQIQLGPLDKAQASLAGGDINVLCVSVAAAERQQMIRSLVARDKLSVAILLGNEETAGIYNIVFRYLFDRRRDLALPTSFLVNRAGEIVKVYQGAIAPARLLEDVRTMPKSSADFQRKALPFPGTAYLEDFQRNEFTYALALYQRGYLAAAEQAFQNVTAAQPNNADAHYNLGTLYLTRNVLPEARRSLTQALKLKPEYAEAWNNLGMISAQQGQPAEAREEFQKALQLRPAYVTALLNYGNFLRSRGELDEAYTNLSRALKVAPDNSDANYSMGMIYAQRNELQRGSAFLEKSLELRPDRADALNNLGVLLVRQERYPEAQEKFETCIRLVPQYDQAYLNLARLYVVLHDKEKAREALKALLRQQPGHKIAQQTLEMLD